MNVPLGKLKPALNKSNLATGHLPVANGPLKNAAPKTFRFLTPHPSAFKTAGPRTGSELTRPVSRPLSHPASRQVTHPVNRPSLARSSGQASTTEKSPNNAAHTFPGPRSGLVVRSPLKATSLPLPGRTTSLSPASSLTPKTWPPSRQKAIASLASSTRLKSPSHVASPAVDKSSPVTAASPSLALTTLSTASHASPTHVSPPNRGATAKQKKVAQGTVTSLFSPPKRKRMRQQTLSMFRPTEEDDEDDEGNEEEEDQKMAEAMKEKMTHSKQQKQECGRPRSQAQASMTQKQRRQLAKRMERLEQERQRKALIDPSLYAVPANEEAKDSDLPVLRPQLTFAEMEMISATPQSLFQIREIEQHPLTNEMWIFGVTALGHSLSLRVGFQPWFFVTCATIDHWQTSDLERLKKTLNGSSYGGAPFKQCWKPPNHSSHGNQNHNSKPKNQVERVVSLSFEKRRELIGFNFEQDTRVIRVVCRSIPDHRTVLKQIRELTDPLVHFHKSPDGVIREKVLQSARSLLHLHTKPSEQHVVFPAFTGFKCFNDEMPMRVMFLAAIRASMYGWVTVKTGKITWAQPKKPKKAQDDDCDNDDDEDLPLHTGSKWSYKSKTSDPQKKVTFSQLEGTCSETKDVTPVLDREDIAPLLRVSFDIETVSATSAKHKPHPGNRGDMIFAISNYFYRYGQTDPVAAVILCLGPTNPVPLLDKNLPPESSQKSEAGEGSQKTNKIGAGQGSSKIGAGQGSTKIGAGQGSICANTRTLCYSTEAALLRAWYKLVFVHGDVDELLGYNSMNYDMPYIYERGKQLRIPELRLLSKFQSLVVEPKKKESSSAQRGDDIFVVLEMLGRTQFDVYRVVKKEKKLSSYKLKDVVANLLLKGVDKEAQARLGKLDLSYELMRPYFMTPGEEGRARRQEMSIYCLRDSEITMRLALQNQFCENYMQMARLCHTSNGQLMTSGEAVKVWNYACCMMETEGWVLNKQDLLDLSKAFPIKYAGGKVLDAKTGYYNRVIITGDFSSLYPSIHIANQICYSTLLLDPKKIVAVREAGYLVLEVDIGEKYNPHFVQGFGTVPASEATGPEHAERQMKTLLPQMLKSLLAARKVAQNQMKATEDPFLAAVLNGKQLAIKVTSNSCYGFCGAGAGGERKKTKKQREKEDLMTEEEMLGGPQNGKGFQKKKDSGGGFLTCVAIASAVCATGRKMIGMVKDALEKQGAECIYGDTDSVMFIPKEYQNFVCPTNPTQEELVELTKMMMFSETMVDNISKMFVKPIKWAFEKASTSTLSLGKKKYAMAIYELEAVKAGEDGAKPAWPLPKTAFFKGIKARGLESVRRDWCPLSTSTGKKLLNMAMTNAGLPALTAEFKLVVAKMERNEYPLEDYVLTKALKANYDTEKILHWQVAKKIAERDPSRALIPGERVAYVVVNQGKAAHLSGEDVEYARQHNIRPDLNYYFTKQLLVPSARIAKAFDPNIEDKWRLLGANLKRMSERNHDITGFFNKPTSKP